MLVVCHRVVAVGTANCKVPQSLSIQYLIIFRCRMLRSWLIWSRGDGEFLDGLASRTVEGYLGLTFLPEFCSEMRCRWTFSRCLFADLEAGDGRVPVSSHSAWPSSHIPHFLSRPASTSEGLHATALNGTTSPTSQFSYKFQHPQLP